MGGVGGADGAVGGVVVCANRAMGLAILLVVVVLVDERVLVVGAEGILGGLLDVVAGVREVFKWRARVLTEVPSCVTGDCGGAEPEEPVIFVSLAGSLRWCGYEITYHMITPNPTAVLFMVHAFSASPVPAGKSAHPPLAFILSSFSFFSPSEMPPFVYAATETNAANQRSCFFFFFSVRNHSL